MPLYVNLAKKKTFFLKKMFVKKAFLFFFSIQSLFEAGLDSLFQRPSVMIPLVLRANDPKLLRDFLSLEEAEEITLDDTKGVFTGVAIGNIFALLIFIIRYFQFLKNRKKQKVRPESKVCFE